MSNKRATWSERRDYLLSQLRPDLRESEEVKKILSTMRAPPKKEDRGYEGQQEGSNNEALGLLFDMVLHPPPLPIRSREEIEKALFLGNRDGVNINWLKWVLRETDQTPNSLCPRSCTRHTRWKSRSFFVGTRLLRNLRKSFFLP